MFDNSKYKNDLKIVVDNTKQGNKKDDDNEILIIESGEDNMDSHVNDVSSDDIKQQLNDIHTVEMESEPDEIEFHVNLDKVPLSLKNTILGSKLYINESYEKEKIDDLVRIL